MNPNEVDIISCYMNYCDGLLDAAMCVPGKFSIGLLTVLSTNKKKELEDEYNGKIDGSIFFSRLDPDEDAEFDYKTTKNITFKLNV